MKMKKKIFKILENVMAIVSIAFVVWIVASWVDTNQHNNPMEEDYKDYAKWNMFEIVMAYDVD